MAQYGRYGYRQITALWQEDRWVVRLNPATSKVNGEVLAKENHHANQQLPS